MIVFKTFLKVLNKCKVPIILYTVLLVVFGGLNMQTNQTSTDFVASKPDILIVNKDEEIGITKNLIEYMKENCNIINVRDTDEAIDDALFYRDVNYVIYIPENYRENFLKGENPKIEIKSTGDYQASFAEMLLQRYIKIANIYNENKESEEELISKINETISKETQVEITSKLDTNQLAKMTNYYNFTNYSILAGCVYVICLILSSFKEEKIRKRTIISSMNYKKLNRELLLSNCLFAIVLWIAYIILGFVLIGKTIFETHGLIYIMNSFIFTICAVTIAFLIGNVMNNKNAINGIVNVISLGTSFLCGAFVPMDFLPDFVLKIAHILPSYYYIYNNELIAKLETINIENLKPILTNNAIILAFTIGFIIITNIFSKKKQKIA